MIGWFRFLPDMSPWNLASPKGSTLPFAVTIQYPAPVGVGSISTAGESTAPTADPWNGASKANTPPSEATIQ